MPKRFRDTEIWDKVWFRKSKPKYKCFISYLFDKCDHAGIWEVDKDRMEFYIYDKFKESLDDLLNMYSEHIIKISNTKWFLVDFIPFQYKCKIENLNPKNTVHKSVIDILAKYDVINILKKIDDKKSKGFISPLKGAKDKDKDKDQSKDKDRDKDKDKDKDRVLDFLDYFNMRVGKKFKLTEDREDLIKKKLKKGYTIEELKKATDNFIQDPWDNRENYLDLIYCIGKQKGKPDNLERWLNWQPDPLDGKISEKTKKSLKSITNWGKSTEERKDDK